MGDQPDGHDVKLADAGAPDANTLTLNTLTLMFQRYAGVMGDDPVRGIEGVPFKIRVKTEVKQTEKTATDPAGRVGYAGAPTFEVEVFDTVYEVTQTALPDLDTPAGIRARLESLGYEPGPKVSLSVALDAAVCAFQTDAAVTRMGILPALAAINTDGPKPVANITKAEHLLGKDAATKTKLGEAAKKT